MLIYFELGPRLVYLRGLSKGKKTKNKEIPKHQNLSSPLPRLLVLCFYLDVISLSEIVLLKNCVYSVGYFPPNDEKHINFRLLLVLYWGA